MSYILLLFFALRFDLAVAVRGVTPFNEAGSRLFQTGSKVPLCCVGVIPGRGFVWLGRTPTETSACAAAERGLVEEGGGRKSLGRWGS